LFGGKSLFFWLQSWLQFGQKSGISIATKRYESKNISYRQTTKKSCNTKKNPLSVAMQQIADLVEVRGVEPLLKIHKTVVIEYILFFWLQFWLQFA
jgi:hypothetical protein